MNKSDKMSNNTTNSQITCENLSWSINELYSKYAEISKPKPQRDSNWTILPVNSNAPNYKDYITFLINNKNSVFPISLGTQISNGKENYIVIDGNNRINAIITFMKLPYQIFPEYYVSIFNIIQNSGIEETIKNDCKKCIETLDYKKISSFRRLAEIFPTSIELNSDLFRKIENELVDIQKKLLTNDNSPFHLEIKLNINIFKKGTGNEYNKIFLDINKYQNVLSVNELLASILYNTHIDISNNDLKYKINCKIKEFYDNKGKNEVLEQYKHVTEHESTMTAYDFMVGFQNYCSDNYNVINQFDSSGLSLFFKIYKYLFDDIEPENFINENIAIFIEKILFSCEILDNAYNSIFPSNIDERIFNKAAIKTNKVIKKNPMLLILVSIIANKDIIEPNELVKMNKIVIMYHILSDKKYLKNSCTENEINNFKTFDKIEYQAGGAFIDGICNTILTKEPNKIFNITKAIFENMLNKNNESNRKPKSYNGSNVNGKKISKRRKLNLFDKIMISNYWNRNIPNKFLKEQYSIEHITPFSSIWINEIDIDRLGNIFPTFHEINISRGNRDLEPYKTCELYNSIKPLLPIENYNKINLYDSKKTTIISNELYNQYCLENERNYISNLVSELYE